MKRHACLNLSVAVGTYLPRAGITWSQPPSRMPVPAAANCIGARPLLTLLAGWGRKHALRVALALL